MAEYRISIYGRKQSEWDQLASWIVNNDLYSENVVWLIQVTAASSFFFLSFNFYASLRNHAAGKSALVLQFTESFSHALFLAKCYTLF